MPIQCRPSVRLFADLVRYLTDDGVQLELR
jgi:hypothetical protein